MYTIKKITLKGKKAYLILGEDGKGINDNYPYPTKEGAQRLAETLRRLRE